VWQENCGRKSATEKVQEENYDIKCVVGKVWQKKCGRIITAEKMW
jgi:hypothetical protein